MRVYQSPSSIDQRPPELLLLDLTQTKRLHEHRAEGTGAPRAGELRGERDGCGCCRWRVAAARHRRRPTRVPPVLKRLFQKTRSPELHHGHWDAHQQVPGVRQDANAVRVYQSPSSIDQRPPELLLLDLTQTKRLHEHRAEGTGAPRAGELRGERDGCGCCRWRVAAARHRRRPTRVPPVLKRLFQKTRSPELHHGHWDAHQHPSGPAAVPNRGVRQG